MGVKVALVMFRIITPHHLGLRCHSSLLRTRFKVNTTNPIFIKTAGTTDLRVLIYDQWI